MDTATLPPPPPLDAIDAALRRLSPYIERTPARRWKPDHGAEALPECDLHLKLELFQRTGTFKARGALVNVLEAGEEALERGVTTVSAGNHAIAVAFAARAVGTSAHVVMLDSANAGRVARCRGYGAEIERASTGAAGFERAREIEAEEGRLFIHPFEGVRTILGTATLGLELGRQLDGLEAVVVPVGGGGLIAGVAAALKSLGPGCAVYGVEPEGADSMSRSLAAGAPMSIEEVRTIADSLGAPHAAPYGFSLVRRFVDDVVLVDDDALRRAMKLLFDDAKIVAEPAAAAPLAALAGPLADRLKGARVALLVSGSNIDRASFADHLARAADAGP